MEFKSESVGVVLKKKMGDPSLVSRGSEKAVDYAPKKKTLCVVETFRFETLRISHITWKLKLCVVKKKINAEEKAAKRWKIEIARLNISSNKRSRFYNELNKKCLPSTFRTPFPVFSTLRPLSSVRIFIKMHIPEPTSSNSSSSSRKSNSKSIVLESVAGTFSL